MSKNILLLFVDENNLHLLILLLKTRHKRKQKTHKKIGVLYFSYC